MMKKLKFNNIYQIVSIILFIIGLLFAFIVAESDDAPGFIIFGSAITTGCCLMLYGFGSLLDTIKKNNTILNDIYKELKNKK